MIGWLIWYCRNFEEWKTAHIEFFQAIKPDFDENTKVEFEIFEVTEILTKENSINVDF